MATYNYAKATRGVAQPIRQLGEYATEQFAARARHEHICREGLQAFNPMDAWDDAAGLMVSTGKCRQKRAAAPTRQSSRARKVSRAAEASAEQESMVF